VTVALTASASTAGSNGRRTDDEIDTLTCPLGVRHGLSLHTSDIRSGSSVTPWSRSTISAAVCARSYACAPLSAVTNARPASRVAAATPYDAACTLNTTRMMYASGSISRIAR
jgi:hypothetical protein